MSNPQPIEVTEELERQAWNLRMRCFTHDEIAKELGVNESTVSRMLKRMGEKLTEAFKEEIAQLRIEQTGQLLHIARTALNAWEQSQQPQPSQPPASTPHKQEPAGETSQSQNPANPDNPLNPGSDKGKPTYLKIALQAYAAVRALWGLEPSKKAEAIPPEPYIEEWPDIDIERFKNQHLHREEYDNELETT